MATSKLVTYPVSEFLEAAGVSESWLRRAEHQGLRVLKSGGKRYVRGADWEAFLVSRNNKHTKGIDT